MLCYVMLTTKPLSRTSRRYGDVNDRCIGCRCLWRRLDPRPSLYGDQSPATALLMTARPVYMPSSSGCRRRRTKRRKSPAYCSELPASAVPRSLQRHQANSASYSRRGGK